MKPQRPAGPRLGELLETRGRIQRDRLHEALRHQRASGGRLGTCLVELEMISENDLLHVLSDQLKVPFTPPEDLRNLTEEVVKLLPEKVARKRFSIPLRSSSTHLTVAMRDPADLVALDELAFVSGKRIRPQVASEIRILEALAKFYGVELADRFVKLLDRLNRERFFWPRDEAAQAAPPAVVELPRISPPPGAPDVRTPSPEPPATAAPSAPAPTRMPSGEILAPIVTHFARPAQAVATAPPPPAPVPAAPIAAAAPAPRLAPPPSIAPQETSRSPAASSTVTPVPTSAAPAPGAGAPAAPTRMSSEEAEARLRDPSGRDEIGRLLLDFARGRAASALLLMVRRDEAAGWLGFGPGLDDESVESCKVDLHAPSFVRALRDGASTHRGALAELPAHAEIRAMLGTNWATDLLALPLRVRERLVGVLVMTLEEGAFSPERIEELTRLVGKASMALELLVLKQKLHG